MLLNKQIIEVFTLTIATLALERNIQLASCSEKNEDAIPITSAVNIRSTNFDIKTKMYSTLNLYSNKVPRIDDVIQKADVYNTSNLFSKYIQTRIRIRNKQDAEWEEIENKYYDVQYREEMELYNTFGKNWDADAKVTTSDINDNKNIKRKKETPAQPDNISAILNAVRNYHELVGIPLANEIIQAEEKGKFNIKIKSKPCRGRVAGGKHIDIGDFPFFVSIQFSSYFKS